MADVHEVFDLVTEALYQSAEFGLLSRSRQHQQFARTVADSLAVIQSAVPDTVPGDLSFPTPIIDYCPGQDRFGRFIEQLLAPFTYQPAIFKTLLNTLERNLYHASGFDWPPHPDDAHRYTSRLVSPSQYRARDTKDIAEAYLRDTPLLWLFQAEVPFSIDQRDRYEGHWIVAHPGAGKTQALSYLIEHDLELVARGQASMIIMDSQGNTPGYGDKPPTLLHTLSHLQMFAPGGALHGKLVYIDPADDPTIPFNIFDLGLGGTPEQRYAASGQLLSFVLSGLVADAFTPPMEILFSNCLELLFTIPGATLDDLMRLLEPDGAEHFKAAISKLPDPHLRSYFANHFKRTADVTKQAVLMRLMGLRRFPAFKRLISHPTTEFNLSAELERGKVIVFDTNEGELGKVGTAVLGRFVLALIAAVGRNRVLLPESRKLPVFVHIDELGNYCASGASHLNDILSLVRKQNIAMCMANQRTSQIHDPDVLRALLSTTIKFANPDDHDAHALSREMGDTPPGFLTNRARGSFAAHVLGKLPRAVSIQIPYPNLSALPAMNAAEYGALRDSIRRRYGPVRSKPTPAAAATERLRPSNLADAYRELAEAERRQDWAWAAELKYSLIPELERDQPDGGGGGAPDDPDRPHDWS